MTFFGFGVDADPEDWEWWHCDNTIDCPYGTWCEKNYAFSLCAHGYQPGKSRSPCESSSDCAGFLPCAQIASENRGYCCEAGETLKADPVTGDLLCWGNECESDSDCGLHAGCQRGFCRCHNWYSKNNPDDPQSYCSGPKKNWSCAGRGTHCDVLGPEWVCSGDNCIPRYLHDKPEGRTCSSPDDCASGFCSRDGICVIGDTPPPPPPFPPPNPVTPPIVPENNNVSTSGVRIGLFALSIVAGFLGVSLLLPRVEKQLLARRVLV